MSKLQFAFLLFLEDNSENEKKDFSFAIKACIKPPRKGNKKEEKTKTMKPVAIV